MKKVLRLKALLPMLILLGILVIFKSFLLGPIITKFTINHVQNITEAKVDIQKTKLTLIPLTITYHHLHIADKDRPFTNLVQVNTATLSLEASQLLKRKLIINDITSTGLAFNTPRKTSGALKTTTKKPSPDTIKSPSKETKSSPKQHASKRPKINIQDIISTQNLSITKTKDHLQKDIEEFKTNINKTFQDPTFEKDLDQLNTQIETLKTLAPNSLNDLLQAKEAIEKINKIKQTLETKKDYYEEKKQRLTQDYNTLQNATKKLKQAANTDYNTLSSTLTLDTLKKPSNISTFLTPKYQKYLTYATKAFDIIKALSNKETKEATTSSTQPTTYKTIHFKTNNNYPRLWIKKATFKGENNQIKTHNFSSNQRITSKPFTLTYKTGTNQNKILSLNANYITTPNETIQVLYKNIPLANTSLTDINNTPLQLKTGVINTTGYLNRTTSQAFSGKLSSTISQHSFNTNDFQNNTITTQTLNQIEQIKTLTIATTINQNKIAIKSNINNAITNIFNTQKDAQIANAKQQLKTRLNTLAATEQTQLNTLLNQQEDSLQNNLLTSLKKINILEEEIDQLYKQYEPKVNDYKKQAEDFINKNLKDLF